MADTVNVSTIVESIIVSDPTTLSPVSITEDVISIGSGAEQINVQPELDSVQVTEAVSSVSVKDVTETVTPDVQEVQVQILEGSKVPRAKRVDFIDDDNFYKGEAVPGVLNSEPKWRINITAIQTDGDSSKTWANGNANYDKVWDDRAAYTYT